MSVSEGNYGDDSHGECAVPMFHRFHAPASPQSNSVFWYSFDYGLVHVVQISSEHDFYRGSRQHSWLTGDLMSVNRSVTPWVVLTSHRMMYSTQVGNAGDFFVSELLKAELEDLISGKVHGNACK